MRHPVTGQALHAVRALGEAERAALFAEGCFASLMFTIARITDYAMRAVGPRVTKDWRRSRSGSRARRLRRVRPPRRDRV